MTTERKPLVHLATLWQRESKSGNTYYSGFLNGCTLLMFDDGEHPHATREGETVRVWKLLLQERDQPPRGTVQGGAWRHVVPRRGGGAVATGAGKAAARAAGRRV